MIINAGTIGTVDVPYGRSISTEGDVVLGVLLNGMSTLVKTGSVQYMHVNGDRYMVDRVFMDDPTPKFADIDLPHGKSTNVQNPDWRYSTNSNPNLLNQYSNTLGYKENPISTSFYSYYYLGESVPTSTLYFLPYGSGVAIVILPDTCTSIGARTFAECASLKLVEIPSNVTDIAADAFEDSPSAVIVTTARNCSLEYARAHHIDCILLMK